MFISYGEEIREEHGSAHCCWWSDGQPFAPANLRLAFAMQGVLGCTHDTLVSSGRLDQQLVTYNGWIAAGKAIYVQLLDLLKMNLKKNEIHHWISRELLLFCWDPFSKSKPPEPAPGLALHPWWEPLKWSGHRKKHRQIKRSICSI